MKNTSTVDISIQATSPLSITGVTTASAASVTTSAASCAQAGRAAAAASAVSPISCEIFFILPYPSAGRVRARRR